MARLATITSLVLLVVCVATVARSDPQEAAKRLERAVAAALESGDAASLAQLFPKDRKVSAFLDQIADLKGYVGPGPLVEAIRRHLAGRSEVRFEGARASCEDENSGPIRLKGMLLSRDPEGRKERIQLQFVFTRIEGKWRAIEVRETG